MCRLHGGALLLQRCAVRLLQSRLRPDGSPPDRQPSLCLLACPPARLPGTPRPFLRPGVQPSWVRGSTSGRCRTSWPWRGCARPTMRVSWWAVQGAHHCPRLATGREAAGDDPLILGCGAGREAAAAAACAKAGLCGNSLSAAPQPTHPASHARPPGSVRSWRLPHAVADRCDGAAHCGVRAAKLHVPLPARRAGHLAGCHFSILCLRVRCVVSVGEGWDQGFARRSCK